MARERRTVQHGFSRECVDDGSLLLHAHYRLWMVRVINFDF